MGGAGVVWVWCGCDFASTSTVATSTLPVLKSITCCLLHLPLSLHTGPGGKVPKDDERLHRVPQEEGRGAEVEEETVFQG